MQKKKARRNRGNELHHGVAEGYLFPAGPAAAPEQKKAENGDIVSPGDLAPAAGAMGRRRDNGFGPGEAVDADIEKAPYDQTEKECNDQYHILDMPVTGIF